MPSQQELIAQSGSDRGIQLMHRLGIPATRANWIMMNWVELDGTETLTAEQEMVVPEAFQLDYLTKEPLVAVIPPPQD